ncbi:MAG: P-loop NTPase fold protein [Acidobacteriota bacterium]
MEKYQVFDTPLANPDNDLFGMRDYARKLANFIEGVRPPFTIGIYGEWGEGKTSFVHLLEHFFKDGKPENSVKFISFSAWPHTTSDALWRAMIIKIAQDLFEITDEKTADKNDKNDSDKSANDKKTAAAAPQTDGLWPLIADFLVKDALVLRPSPAKQDRHAEYHDLIARLDRTAYGSISKNSEQHVQVNQEVALMTIVNGAVTALGAVSPLVAQLRTLFGLKPDLNLAELLQTEKNTATRKIIESVEEFKQVFSELFRTQADGKLVFVFVDDLDRCLPDVALDVLEAIKIFLPEKVDCIFIVAADQDLISQGLRLRYKALAENNDQAQSFFVQKGQEYFEKIIQFGVRVPPRTVEQGYLFIAAQFPNWTAASDIIQCAIGSNPRRLKQYCNLLSYKHAVAQMQSEAANAARLPGDTSPTMDKATLHLLDKVITLHSWSPGCLALIATRACCDDYADVMERLLRSLQSAKEDNPLPQQEAGLPDEDSYRLYQETVNSAPLFQLLQASPLFHASPPEQIVVFAKLADIAPAPEPEKILRTGDRVFMRLLEEVIERGTTDDPELVKKLMIADLTKLIVFDEDYSQAFALLRQLAGDDQWAPQLAAVETRLDQALNGQKLNAATLAPLGQKLFELLRPVPDAAGNVTPLLKDFLARPRFSETMREELLAYDGLRDKLPGAEPSFSIALQDISRDERYRTKAANLVEQVRGRERNAELKEIELAFRLRQQAAQHFLALRKFAKLDALAYKWPRLADRLRIDGASPLKELEARVIQPAATVPGTGGSWDEWLKDEQLLRFLRLRPLFRSIYPDELDKYFAVSQAVAKAPESPAASPQPAAAKEPSTTYQNWILSITQGDDAVSNGTDKRAKFQVKLYQDDKPDEIISSGDVFADLEQLAALSTGFEEVFSQQFTTRNLRAAIEPLAYLQEVGTKLYEIFFQSRHMRERLLELLESKERIRLALKLNGPGLTLLPWECLYVPGLQIFPGLVQKFSLPRYLPIERQLFSRTLTSPLKILAVLSNPSDAPYLPEGKQEAEVLERVLAPAVQAGQVELRFLHPPTISELQHQMRVFRPHLFHFIGHGTHLPDTDAGALLFEDESGKTHLVEAEELYKLLVVSEISLAILNACDTGVANTNKEVSGVAQALVRKGIPITIATMRAIFDPAAVKFTSEFYRSLVDGYTVEGSLIEARLALSVKKWDWPAYAIFSNTLELDALRLIPQPRGKEPGQEGN